MSINTGGCWVVEREVDAHCGPTDNIRWTRKGRPHRKRSRRGKKWKKRKKRQARFSAHGSRCSSSPPISLTPSARLIAPPYGASSFLLLLSFLLQSSSYCVFLHCSPSTIIHIPRKTIVEDLVSPATRFPRYVHQLLFVYLASPRPDLCRFDRNLREMPLQDLR